MKVKKLFIGKFGKTLALALSFALIGSTSAFANPSENILTNVENGIIDCVEVKGDLSYEYDNNGKPIKEIVKVSNVEEYAKEAGIILPSPDAEITLIRPIINVTDIPKTESQSPDISARAGNDYFIKNVQAPRLACGQETIRTSFYDPPGGVMTVSESVSATFGGSVSVNVAVVSAAVNFSVTQTYSVSDSQTVVVPSGKTGKVTAYPIYNLYQYEIWERDVFIDDYVGTGYASKPVGVCFTVVTY